MNLFEYSVLGIFRKNIVRGNKNKLTAFGRKNYGLLREHFNSLKLNNVGLFISYRDEGVNGNFNSDNGTLSISITVDALNKMTIGGLKSFMAHEVGHILHDDLGFKYKFSEFIRYMGFDYIANTLSRFVEFKADKYAFKCHGTRIYQCLIQFEMDRIKSNDDNDLFSNIYYSGTHPSPSQRIFFVKNKYKMDLKTVITLLYPFTRVKNRRISINVKKES